ncbi:MAG: XdhC family protein [Oscillospiraceae bacterium]|nr:XdhC family protein [Oscillospiraceae bacterium]MBQ6609792.1 XdhC family protein [Oscillospiraceae bacterium]
MSNLYAEVLEQIGRIQPVTVRTVITGREGSIETGLRRTLSEGVTPVIDPKGRRFASVTTARGGDTLTVCEPVMPRERLLVLGGGHIALPVCEFAAKCGFEVHVVDDRPEFANRSRFPDAADVVCDSFENGILRFGVTPFDYVVVITRGHRHDADCLRALLPGAEPAYLGMIGSRRRTKGLLEMLADEGFDPDRLGKICTPIGLDIGAITPAEIAVSILSEVIAYKRKPEHGAPGRCCADSDLELSTLAYLAENREPKAIVTVIETKGSTPRGSGAKMAVSPLGKVTGSIGGGCSEAAVIHDAVRIIGTGRYKIVEIDLTGEVAESDGMVCGGTMKVLVEDACEG